MSLFSDPVTNLSGALYVGEQSEPMGVCDVIMPLEVKPIITSFNYRHSNH